MINFFQKGATMTKRISGDAHLVDAPEIHARPKWSISGIGRFERKDGTVTSILLEIADTEESRRRGMMGRASMPEICGMLFDGLSRGGYFWMKDCLIPLDVIFMDAKGFVTKTYSMEVDPMGSRHYSYDPDDVSAVEVVYGFVDKNKISAGSKVMIKRLGKETHRG